MTITEFLLARIAEDEAEATAMLRRYREGGDTSSRRWRRMLAECEAKRRIVEREESNMRTEWRRRSEEHRQTWEQWLARKGQGEMLTLRDLASVYADHPDFDPAWRAG